MKAVIRNRHYGPAIPLIMLFGAGAGFLSSWILETFGLGAEISGLTQGVLVYYFASMVISAGLLIAYKAPRTVGIYMCLYPFGLFAIFFVGFNSTLADPSQSPNQLNQMADGMAAMQAALVQGFIWIVPAAVTGYYIYKARRDAAKPACK